MLQPAAPYPRGGAAGDAENDTEGYPAKMIRTRGARHRPGIEALDVLTVTAKKLSSLKLGRKFSGGPRDGKGPRNGKGANSAAPSLHGVRRAWALEGGRRVSHDSTIAATDLFLFYHSRRHRFQGQTRRPPGLLCEAGQMQQNDSPGSWFWILRGRVALAAARQKKETRVMR